MSITEEIMRDAIILTEDYANRFGKVFHSGEILFKNKVGQYERHGTVWGGTVVGSIHDLNGNFRMCRMSKEVELIFIGDRFHHESETKMASIYTIEGARYDWGFVQRDLRDGKSISIRQATTIELEPYEQELQRVVTGLSENPKTTSQDS